MPKRDTRTEKRLKEAEILLQRIRDAGMLGGRKPKPKSRPGRLAVLIDGDDVTIIRPGRGGNRSRTDFSYGDYGYEGYAYGDYGYGGFFYASGAYDAYGYDENYDIYGYDFYDYEGYEGYENYAYDNGDAPGRRLKRSGRGTGKGDVTITIQLRSNGQILVSKGLCAEQNARRRFRRFGNQR